MKNNTYLTSLKQLNFYFLLTITLHFYTLYNLLMGLIQAIQPIIDKLEEIGIIIMMIIEIILLHLFVRVLWQIIVQLI